MKFENDAERIAMIVSINSIIGNLLLSLGKLIAGFVAQSAAMVSDGIHSASDVFGTLIVMAGVKFSNKASDEDHPYGHERIECIAAILLAIILTIIALLIGYSGYEKIVGDPAELEDSLLCGQQLFPLLLRKQCSGTPATPHKKSIPAP